LRVVLPAMNIGVYVNDFLKIIAGGSNI